MLRSEEKPERSKCRDPETKVVNVRDGKARVVAASGRGKECLQRVEDEVEQDMGTDDVRE